MFNLAAAIIPSLILLFYLQIVDRFTQSSRQIWVTFGLGILSAVFVGFLIYPLDLFISKISSPLSYALAWATIGSAIPEESMKMLVILLYCMRRNSFQSKMDGIVFGATASLGFATLENIFYVVESDIYTAIIRAFSAVPSHAMGGAIMGYFLVKALLNQDAKYSNFCFAWLIPVGLHALYNFPLFLIEGIYNSGSQVLWLMFLFFVAITFSAIWIEYQLVKRFISNANDEIKYQPFGEYPSNVSKSYLKITDRIM